MVEGEVDDAVFDTRAEYASDGEDYVETKLTCDDCGDEYTVAVRASAGRKSISVVGFPDIDVEADDTTFEREYDDYLADYNPDDPYGVYNKTIRELDNLHYGSTILESAQPAFHKMVCLQHIIAVEAYLSDRLIKIVTNDSDKLLALVGSTAALRETQPKLIDIARDPNYVATATKNYLQRFSFHDLAKVSEFYKAVLKINIFENEGNEKELLEIIKMRHDLVHRSGRDNDGKDVEIKDEHVGILKGLMVKLVTRIEGAHTAYAANRYFSSVTPPVRSDTGE
jgi:CRISPR/Cas system CSM-associated protein Csm2 small subunit